MQPMVNKIKIDIRNKLLAGVVTLIPIAVTIYMFRVFIGFFDGIILPLFDRLFGFHFPGLGFLLSLILLYLLGQMMTHILGRRMFALFERWLNYIPLVRSVYQTTKQVLSAFSFSASGFEKVVFLEYPRRGVWTIGFVTGESVSPDGQEYYHLFVPTTPNPTSGWAQFIPKDQVIPSDMTIEQGLKAVISAGSITPRQMNFDARRDESSADRTAGEQS